MASCKAEFFDSQVEEEWATVEYSREKLAKIDRMLYLARVKRGMKALEPGCGTGRLTRILGERVGLEGHEVAIDMSEKMIEACLRKTEWRPHFEIVCSAMEDYPLAWGEFAAVLCYQVFPHFDNKHGVLELFSKLLKP